MCFIGSGLAPAIFYKLDIKLDIFYSYACGIEFFNDPSLLSFLEYAKKEKLKLSNLKTKILNKLTIATRNSQILGVKKTNFIINSQFDVTKDALESINMNYINLQIPMVYKYREVLDHGVYKKIKSYLSGYDFKIMYHARHLWVNKHYYDEFKFQNQNKGTDILIRGFARFLNSVDQKKVVLIMVEYGPDVIESKSLCAELGINNNVIWLPKLSRKELMFYLQNCDVCCGQFGTKNGLLWGGSAWEVLACGKPLLQSFNFTDDEYFNYFNEPPPPILDVKGEVDVVNHLQAMFNDRDLCVEYGKKSFDWFNCYNGYNLAQKWLEIINKANRYEFIKK